MATDPLIAEYKAIAERARKRYFALFAEREQIEQAMQQAQLDHHHAQQWAEQLENANDE